MGNKHGSHLAIQTLKPSDLDALTRLRESAVRHAPTITQSALHQLIAVGCLWGYWQDGALMATVGLDLPGRQLVALHTSPQSGNAPSHIPRYVVRLIEYAERAAAAFLLHELQVQPHPTLHKLFKAQGYRPRNQQHAETEIDSATTSTPHYKRLHRRYTRFQRHILTLMTELEIPRNYPIHHALPVQPEPSQLTAIGHDIFDRPQRLRPGAAQAWRRMQRAAQQDGITLQVVSAFRSVDYQSDIIRRKRNQGQTSAEIFQVSAAPGFSEHHSGRALDLTTPDCDHVLTATFATTAAYRWLQSNAHRFGFRESYPKHNPHHIAWEPWHWGWQPA